MLKTIFVILLALVLIVSLPLAAFGASAKNPQDTSSQQPPQHPWGEDIPDHPTPDDDQPSYTDSAQEDTQDVSMQTIIDFILYQLP